MPTLGEVERTYGYDFLHAYIEGWIVNFREFVNVGRGMNDVQTYETATLVLQYYNYLTIADINLLFQRAKIGKYGKLYDRLDGQIILDWFARYDAERTACAEEESIQAAERFKYDPYPRTSTTIAAEQADFRKWAMRKNFRKDKTHG